MDNLNLKRIVPVNIGDVKALFRYPVKSMAGESLTVADLGWHSLDSDVVHVAPGHHGEH